MTPLPKSFSDPAGYEELPEPLKQAFTAKEYAWMSDRRKAQLVQDETEPEPES